MLDGFFIPFLPASAHLPIVSVHTSKSPFRMKIEHASLIHHMLGLAFPPNAIEPAFWFHAPRAAHVDSGGFRWR